MVLKDKTYILFGLIILLTGLLVNTVTAQNSEHEKISDKIFVPEYDRSTCISLSTSTVSGSGCVLVDNFPIDQKNQTTLNNDSLPFSKNEDKNNKNTSSFTQYCMNVPQNSFVSNLVNRANNLNDDIMLVLPFCSILSDYSIGKIHNKDDIFLLINPAITPNLENYSLIAANMIKC